MVDWIGMAAAAIVGSSVGGTIGYFIHLKKKAKDKKNVLKDIKAQKHKDFIIPEKYVEDNKVKMRGVKVNLDEYCGIETTYSDSNNGGKK